jgi:CPA2 family monovalent cation:H+ antiporter-2
MPLAAAYVLILAVLGPLAARGIEPVARYINAKRQQRHPVPAQHPASHEALPETTASASSTNGNQ